MAFSNLVLPNVAPVQQGGPLVNAMQGINSLVGNRANTQTAQAQAQYAPYNQYADAYSKITQANMLPYTIQSQILSNPLLYLAYKDNPQALTSMFQNFAKSVPQIGNMANGMQIPLPGQMQSNNPLSSAVNSVKSAFGFGASPSQNAMQSLSSGGQAGSSQNAIGASVPQGSQNSPTASNASISSEGSPSSPLLPGPFGKMISGYVQTPYGPGVLIPDPNNAGKFISVPTSKMTTQLQNQVSAGQRVIPQLKELGDIWKPFLTLQGKADVLKDKAGNLLGMTDEDVPSKYTEAKMKAFTTVESYLKSIGVPVTVDVQSKLEKMIEPSLGENSSGYNARMQNSVKQIINDFTYPALQQLGGGYGNAQDFTKIGGSSNNGESNPVQMNMGAQNNTSQQPVAAPKNTSTNAGNKFDPVEMLNYKFENADEFKQAFSSLNAANKKLVIAEMKKRGWS